VEVRKHLNFKAAALVTLVLGLVLVPIVVAAPAIAQLGTQAGDALQIQEQEKLQTRDCTNTCACNGTGDGTQLQTQVQERLQTCNQQQLQTRERANNCICNGNLSGTALQNRVRICDCSNGEAANGNLTMKQHNNQYRYRNQNQKP